MLRYTRKRYLTLNCVNTDIMYIHSIKRDKFLVVFMLKFFCLVM